MRISAIRNYEFLPPPKFPDLPPDHPVVDQHGNPCPWDQPCEGEIVMVPWPNRFTEWADSGENFTILRGAQLYVHEWVMRKGQDPARFRTVANHVIPFFGLGTHPSKVKIAEGKRYEDMRFAAGAAPGTVRRELRFYLAAMNHNRKRGRFDAVPFLEMPDGESIPPRPLTEEEYRKILRLPLTHRQRMFWRMDYHTGHRSRAIETLTWDRVNFETLTINFNEPGVRKTNKRRADGFPIEPELEAILRAAKARRDALFPNDPYVIGLSRRGKPTCTYRQCKRELALIGVKERGVCRHAVRKLFCTSRIANGKSSALVAALIADDERTMKKHYVKLSSDQMRDAARNERVA